MPNLADLADLTSIQVWDGVVARRVQGECLTIAVVELAPDAIVPQHQHANEQCGLVIEGEVTFRLADEERGGHRRRASSARVAARPLSPDTAAVACHGTGSVP